MGNTGTKPNRKNTITESPSSSNGNRNVISHRMVVDLLQEISETQTEDRYKHIEKKIGVGIIGIGARMSDVLAQLIAHHGGLINIVAVADDAPQAIDEIKHGYCE